MFWIGILYFAEGFPLGVFYDVFPVHFRQQGVDLREIGFVPIKPRISQVRFQRPGLRYAVLRIRSRDDFVSQFFQLGKSLEIHLAKLFQFPFEFPRIFLLTQVIRMANDGILPARHKRCC